MLYVDFPEANFTYGKPSSMTDEECGSLRVFKGFDSEGNQRIISKWQPSYEDIQAIINGGAIYLDIFYNIQPPVALYTENPFIKTEK